MLRCALCCVSPPQPSPALHTPACCSEIQPDPRASPRPGPSAHRSAAAAVTQTRSVSAPRPCSLLGFARRTCRRGLPIGCGLAPRDCTPASAKPSAPGPDSAPAMPPPPPPAALPASAPSPSAAPPPAAPAWALESANLSGDSAPEILVRWISPGCNDRRSHSVTVESGSQVWRPDTTSSSHTTRTHTAHTTMHTTTHANHATAPPPHQPHTEPHRLRAECECAPSRRARGRARPCGSPLCCRPVAQTEVSRAIVSEYSPHLPHGV